MPCIAEFVEPDHTPRPPAQELAELFAEELRNTKSRRKFNLILGRAIAAAGTLLGSGAPLTEFKLALEAGIKV